MRREYPWTSAHRTVVSRRFALSSVIVHMTAPPAAALQSAQDLQLEGKETTERWHRHRHGVPDTSCRPVPRRSAPAGKAALVGGRVPTVLVVEDDPLARMAAVSYLEESGSAVLEAPTGRRGADPDSQSPDIQRRVFGCPDAGSMDGIASSRAIRFRLNGSRQMPPAG